MKVSIRSTTRSRAIRVRAAITSIAAFVSLTTLGACAADDPGGSSNNNATGPRGIIVLDGFIQPGLTLLPDSGTATTRMPFGSTTEFDGSGMTLLHDTVLATSSKGAGDLLYIADLKSGLVQKVQMPKKSNPLTARLLTGSAGQALIGVALRDSSMVALVRVTSSASTMTSITNVGLCPSDVFQFEGATWILDANANCRTDYSAVGAPRLIRVPDNGAKRDTINLPGLIGSAVGVEVIGGEAFVSAGGDVDFSKFPFVLKASGAVAKVDLHTRALRQVKAMPGGTYGAGMARGDDGNLYITIYEDITNFGNRIMEMKPLDMTFVGGHSNLSWRVLKNSAGTEVQCSSGIADARGRLYCLASGLASATSVVVFDTAGVEIRRVSAGQGGVDLKLR